MSAKGSPLPLDLSRSQEAWQALRQAAQALLAVANAALGETGASVVSLPTLSRPVTASVDCLTVRDGINEFLKAKARIGRSDRYLRSLRVSLVSFASGRATVPMDAVSIPDLERWLSAHAWAPRTQRGYLSDVRTLYNFCVRRGLASKNPAAGVELPEETTAPPGIHTPGEVRRVLELARESDLTLCRSLAVRYFAGLRSAEAHRLAEADLRGEYIEVPAAKSKTRQRRLVHIAPSLRAWLDLGGTLPLHDVSNRMRLFTAKLKSAGIAWPHNVTRHSFVSYHLAAFESAGKTALEAGHSEAMLFAHYRELVTPEAAKEFWSILPEKENPRL